MHMIFTEEEKSWIDMRVFGWRIQKGCPTDIRNSIEKKLNVIKNQFSTTIKQ